MAQAKIRKPDFFPMNQKIKTVSIFFPKRVMNHIDNRLKKLKTNEAQLEFTGPYWEKNRNCFDFLIHGEEIRFSNFRLRNLRKFEISRGRMSPRTKPT